MHLLHGPGMSVQITETATATSREIRASFFAASASTRLSGLTAFDALSPILLLGEDESKQEHSMGDWARPTADK